MDGAPAELVLGLLVDYAGVRYTNVAFLMLLLYDHALTFDLEVSRIWTLPWRLPKILFLINRYLIPPMLFFSGLTPNVFLEGLVCDFIAKWTAIPTILSIGTVEVMLILRVLAIYAHSKPMTRFLIGLFACEMIAWITLAVSVTARTSSVTNIHLFTGCLFSAPAYFYTAWIPPVIFECVIVFLTIYKTLKYGKVNAPLRVLARDSSIYFSVIFFLLVGNLFIARYGKGFIGALLIEPSSVVACIAAARMTMNIREFTMNPDATTEHELPTMHFRPGDESTTNRTGTTTVVSGTRLD